MNRRLSSKIIADYIIQAGEEVWLLLREFENSRTLLTTSHPFNR
jgi:hypothetical protein